MDAVRELLFNFLGGIAILYHMSTYKRKSLFVGYLGGNIKGEGSRWLLPTLKQFL